jgi:hypothetical protein
MQKVKIKVKASAGNKAKPTAPTTSGKSYAGNKSIKSADDKEKMKSAADRAYNAKNIEWMKKNVWKEKK